MHMTLFRLNMYLLPLTFYHLVCHQLVEFTQQTLFVRCFTISRSFFPSNFFSTTFSSSLVSCESSAFVCFLHKFNFFTSGFFLYSNAKILMKVLRTKWEKKSATANAFYVIISKSLNKMNKKENRNYKSLECY